MKDVFAKKRLGQHFLTDLNIAQKIADQLDFSGYNKVLEIGPGMGVLTQFLNLKKGTLDLIEIDQESVIYLHQKFPELKNHIHLGDVLKIDLTTIYPSGDFAIIGNFPYNISSQILFKTLENRVRIPFFCGMFQKEVALRICGNPGNKTYGILSVLSQVYYETNYLFDVPPNVFSPPPKVNSGVIALRRKENLVIDFDEKLLFRVVKTGFQQRRKTLRNSLKSLDIPKTILEDSIFDLRPERLSGDQFIELTKLIGNAKV